MKIKAEVLPLKYHIEITAEEACYLLGIADMYRVLPGDIRFEGQFIDLKEHAFATKLVEFLEKKLHVSTLHLKPGNGWPMVFKAEDE